MSLVVKIVVTGLEVGGCLRIHRNTALEGACWAPGSSPLGLPSVVQFPKSRPDRFQCGRRTTSVTTVNTGGSKRAKPRPALSKIGEGKIRLKTSELKLGILAKGQKN